MNSMHKVYLKTIAGIVLTASLFALTSCIKNDGTNQATIEPVQTGQINSEKNNLASSDLSKSIPKSMPKPKVQKMVAVDLAGWQHFTQNFSKEKQSKVLLVDLWATWCISCIEKFPETVEIYQRYRNQPVTFASLNFDQADDHEAIKSANRFLKKSGADFQHFTLTENMMTTFEELNLLGIPAIIFYGADGNELKRLTGDDPSNQFNKDDIEKTLQAFLHN